MSKSKAAITVVITASYLLYLSIKKRQEKKKKILQKLKRKRNKLQRNKSNRIPSPLIGNVKIQTNLLIPVNSDLINSPRKIVIKAEPIKEPLQNQPCLRTKSARSSRKKVVMENQKMPPDPLQVQIPLGNYLRITDELFEILLEKVQEKLTKTTTTMKKPISPRDKLDAMLRFLATGASYRVIASQTCVSKPFLSKEIPKACENIFDSLKQEYLKFPNSIDEWKEIADQFMLTTNFPFCLGALDVKYINIYDRILRQPTEMCLLAIIDADGKFIYIDVKRKISNRADDMLHQSSLMNVIKNADKMLPEDQLTDTGRVLSHVFVANSKFSLQERIMKPYPIDSDHKFKVVFNQRLEKVSQKAKYTMSALSNTFKLLQYEIFLPVEKMIPIIRTCCVLHNFFIDNGITNPPERTTKVKVNNSEVYETNDDKIAEHFRDQFAQHLGQDGFLLKKEE